MSKKSRQSLSPEERELILQLFEDVDTLEKAEGLLAGFPSSTELRNTFTPILRRWIVDGSFFRVQKLSPVPITFLFYSRADGVKNCEAGAYKWWMGIVDCGQNLMVEPAVLSGKVASNQIRDRGPFKIREKAKWFFEQKAFWWKGQFYNRSDLIKFLANKLGGVHYDLQRDQSEAHIQEIQNHFGIQYRHEKRDIYIVPPAEIPVLREDPDVRKDLYDSIQLSVGDTAKIFCSGIRSAEGKIRSLL